MSHIFVMGEDRSYTPQENAQLAAEAETNRDILIAPVEEASETVAAKTKHCIEWITKNHDFDLLVKANDDSTLFLSRLFGEKGWLPPRAVVRGELVYFGKRQALTKVANPANFVDSPTKNGPPVSPVETAAAANAHVDSLFEFDYRGTYWPEHMEGGMYGLSRALTEEIANNNFRTYSSEAATVGVWVSAFRAKALYLADEQVLSGEADYLASNGSVVAASFRTCRLRQASMWCEYTAMGTISQRSILAQDAQQALDCLGSYEGSSLSPRSLPLGARDSHQAGLLKSLGQPWPITEQPNVEMTGRWWRQMGGAFRGKPAAVVGTSATTVDRLPLYLLQGVHTLVMDDFFRVSERYTSWKPTMYMCVDPEVCASHEGRAGGGSGVLRGGGQGQRGAVPNNAESANKYARDVFAAFFILNSSAGGAEYWRYLRQRVNAHWFVAGGGAHGGGAEPRAGVGAGGYADGMGRAGATDMSAENFRSVSRTSGLAMAVEVLSYLGFSPIYVAAAKEELDGGGAAAQQWDEFSVALKLAGSSYGTSFVYLYADDEDKLPKGKAFQQSGSGGRGKATASAAAAGKLSSQEHFMGWAKTRHYDTRAERPANWDLEIFLQHFPAVGRLNIVRNASTVKGMFPSAPVCRDAEDLDRFERAVRCPVKISLKHFSSFLAWHVPYGPVRDTFVWVKR